MGTAAREEGTASGEDDAPGGLSYFSVAEEALRRRAAAMPVGDRERP